MDELKKYLQNHVEELNLDEPRAQVWQNIQQQTPVVKKTRVVIMITRLAAAACILVLAGIGVWHVMNDKKDDQAQVAAVTPGKKIVTPTPAQPGSTVPEKIQPEVPAQTATHTKQTPVTRNPQQQPVNRYRRKCILCFFHSNK